MQRTQKPSFSGFAGKKVQQKMFFQICGERNNGVTEAPVSSRHPKVGGLKKTHKQQRQHQHDNSGSWISILKVPWILDLVSINQIANGSPNIFYFGTTLNTLQETQTGMRTGFQNSGEKGGENIPFRGLLDPNQNVVFSSDLEQFVKKISFFCIGRTIARTFWPNSRPCLPGVYLRGLIRCLCNSFGTGSLKY